MLNAPWALLFLFFFSFFPVCFVVLIVFFRLILLLFFAYIFNIGVNHSFSFCHIHIAYRPSGAPQKRSPSGAATRVFLSFLLPHNLHYSLIVSELRIPPPILERYFTYSEEDKVKAFFLKKLTFRRLIYNELEAAELLLLLAIAILRSAGVQECRSADNSPFAETCSNDNDAIVSS